MTSQLVQRLSNVGVLQTSLEFSEDVIPTGTGVFNGTNSNLVVTSGLSDFAVGLGDYTIEWWQNISVQHSYPRIFSIGSYNIGATLAVSIENNGSDFYVWANGSRILTPRLYIQTNQWNHYAVVRYSGNTTVYQNGTSVETTNAVYNIPTVTRELHIGNESPPDQQYFEGDITNFQWVTGTALYTSNFTPPVIPISPAPNSKLLLLCSTESTLTKDSSGTGKTVVNYNTAWSDNVPSPPFVPGVSNTMVRANTLDEVSLTSRILSTDLWAYFDAGNSASYPGTGVIWYDISGNGFNGIMNLVTWNEASGSLYFTGINSSIDTSISNPGGMPISMSFWVKPTNAIKMHGIYDSAPGQQNVLRQDHVGIGGAVNNTAEWWDGDPYVSTGLTPGVWQYLTVNYHTTDGFRSVDTYVNGVLVQSGVGSPNPSYAWTSYVLGVINGNADWFEGYMAQVQIYKRKPSVEEIAWNYSVDAERYGLPPSVNIYGTAAPGPVISQPVARRDMADGTLQVRGEFDEVTLSRAVTNGLRVYLDANRNASYPGSGDIWYDISGNGNDATLYNSPAYDSWQSARFFTFVPNSLQYGNIPCIGNLARWTIEVWLFTSAPLTTAQATAALTTVFDVPGGAHPGVINYVLGTGGAGPSNNLQAGFFTGSNWVSTSGYQPVLGYWYQFVGTFDGNNLTEYVNGEVNSSASYAWTTAANGGDIRIARRWDGPESYIHYFPGSISIARIYDRALSATEVAQNYFADRDTFATPYPITYGLQMWYDAGNSASYPGSGTTLFDLTGNGYNATLVGSLQFSDPYLYGFSDGNYVQSNNFFLPGTGDFTYSFWVRYDNFNDASSLLEIDCPSFSFLIRAPYGSNPVYINSATNQFAIGFGSPLATNTWYNIVVTRSSTVVSAYINAVAGNNTGVISADISGSSPRLTMGKLQVASGQWLHGELSVFMAYNRALSAAEVLRNFNAYKQRYGL